MFIVILSILIFRSQSAFTTTNILDISTGIFDPFTAPTCEIDEDYSFTLPFVSFPGSRTIRGIGYGIIGFQGVIQSAIYIKLDQTNLNSTHLSLNIQCKQQTMLSKIRYQYIIISRHVQFIVVRNGCFLCGNQTTQNDGSNYYKFSQLNHVRNYEQTMKLMSSIYAINISNYYSSQYQVQVKTSMELNSPNITHEIRTYGHNYLVSICLSTLIVDSNPIYNDDDSHPDSGSSPNYHSVWLMGSDDVNSVSKLSNILPLNSPPQNQFYNLNSMYFGISGIKSLSILNANKFLMLFDPSDLTNMNTNFQSNNNLLHITMQYFYFRKKTCTAKYIPYIYDCVSTCPLPLWQNSVTHYCQICHYTCISCDGTNIYNCKTCSATVHFRDIQNPPNPIVGATGTQKICKCLSGYVQPITINDPVCLKCSDLIPFCDTCTTHTVCDLCLPNFSWDSTLGKCLCSDPVNKYINLGICSPFPGCNIVSTATNQPVYCLQCSAARHFVPTSNSYCKCNETDFIQSPDRSECVDKCGDGKIYTNICDDSNNVNGDGCSSICTIQSGYSCIYDTTFNKSACALIKNYQVYYKYCTRQIGQNSATFYFSIQPPDSLLSRINFKEWITFSFDNTITQTKYDLTTGILSITTTYKKTLEANQHTINLSFDWRYVSNPNVQINFMVNGANAWLNMDQNVKLYTIFTYFALLLNFLVWAVALTAAILGYKNIGIELVYPVQAIYFVLVSVNIKAPGIKSLQFMSLSNGFNLIKGLKFKQAAFSNSNQSFYLQYLLNYNYFIIFNLLCFVTLFILQIIFRSKSKDIYLIRKQKISIINQIKDSKKLTKQEQNDKQFLQSKYNSYSIWKSILNYVGYRFCVSILLYSLQASLFFMSVFFYFRLTSNQYPLLLNVLGSIGSLLMAFIPIMIYPNLQNTQKMMPQQQKQYVYSFQKVYMVQYIIFIILLSMIAASQQILLVLLPVMILVFTVVYVYLRNPYVNIFKQTFHKHLLLIQQIILTVPLISLWLLGLVNNYQSIIYLIATLLSILCVSLSIGISILRIHAEYRYNNPIHKKSQKQKKDKKKQLNLKNVVQNIQKELIDQGKIQDKQAKNKQIKQLDNVYQEISQLQAQLMKQQENNKKYSKIDNQSIDESQNQDIQFIKKKLRKDLRSRRRVPNS